MMRVKILSNMGELNRDCSRHENGTGRGGWYASSFIWNVSEV
jgi:hypothetical protein